MPTFVHLTTEKNSKMILENGIKANEINDEIKKGIFCMPTTQNFMISHQWLRELKRSGQKSIIGVYFKLKDDELIWFGHYSKSHVKTTAAEAVKAVMNSEDGQGFEVIVPRAISPKEIYKLRHISQVVGWRYYPGSHQKKLCLCPACLQKGTFKSTKIREDKYYKLLSKLRTEKTELEILNLLCEINELIIYTPHRLRNVNDFDFLLENPSHRIKAALAYTISRFRSERVLTFLSKLLTNENDEVRRASAEGIMDIMRIKGIQYLGTYKGDNIIDEIINDYKNIYYSEDED